MSLAQIFKRVILSQFGQTIGTCGLALTIFFGIAPTSHAAEETLIPVGVAEIDITPDFPVRLSGFGFRRTESEGVNLKIWAKAIAIPDEKEGPAILITTDNLGVPDDITREVAKRLEPRIGLKLARLSVTATHSHTTPMLKNVCPTLFGVPIPPDHQERIDRYTKEFVDNLEKVALAAYNNIKDRHISWGMGTVNFAINRRTAGGPVDHDLPVLVITETDGKVAGIYFTYACHCVTLSDNKISGDWAGYATKRIEELFPGSVALASVGCGADSNPSSGVTGANLQAADGQGKQIAEEVKRILSDSLKPIQSKPKIHYTRIDLPFAPARSRAEWESRAKRDDAIGHHARVNLERLNRGEALPSGINYAIQTWVFGDQLAMVFLPGETVVDYSLRIKREFDRTRLWVNGYANDSRCYIPSERILKEGGYEGGEAQIYYDAPQYFATGIEKKIMDAVHGQIPAAFKAPPGTEGTRPLSPPEALKTFKVKNGLKVELVAAEPLIQAPVAIDWGADGRLWVCEMNDYPNGMDQNWQPGGQVKFLEDQDGDGKYDKATVFLDKLPFPTGVTAWGKGVFVSAAPDIIYAEDTDGDGKADKVEKLFTGFFTDNFQARVNSLNLGLDNWIYGANGLLGGTIQPLKNSVFPAAEKPLDIRNRDFRFHPFKGTFETASGLTQQGRVRDDFGNWFGCDNSQMLLHFPVSEQYIKRNPHIIAPSPVRNLTARPDGNRIFPTSRLQERFNDPEAANRATSAAGLGIYRDNLLGEEFEGNAFTCEPVHNLVHREIIERNVALTSRRADDEKQSEFLTSTDNWFRPVQARSGPDGALYIVDMYRFLIEHPRWIPAARLAQIDIRAGADKGRIYRVVKEGTPLRPVRDLTRMNGTALASALDVPNGINRDRVHAALLFRKDKAAVAPLRKMATSASMPQVRVQALAVLDGLNGLDEELLQSKLKDENRLVRQHAIRLCEPFLREPEPNQKLISSLLALVDDPSVLVVRQLAYSLGESKSPEAGKALAKIATKWIGNVEVRTAVLSSANFHADAILNAVLANVTNQAGKNEWITPLLATLVNSNDPVAISKAVDLVLPVEGRDISGEQLGILANLLDSVDQKSAGSKLFAEGSTNKKRLDTAIKGAMKIASDESAPASTRTLAVALVGRGHTEPETTLLAKMARAGGGEFRKAALGSLRKQRGKAIAKALLADWHQASPAARTDIVNLLIDRDEWTSTLLQAIQEGTVRPHEVSLADRQRLASSNDAKIRKLAEEVLPAAPATGRNEVVAQYKEVLSLQGNPTRGSAIFEKNCAACHKLNGAGHEVGPDLATLSSKDPEYWVKNILDPNAVVEPRFVSYNVELNDDRSLSGVIRGETANSLTIINGSGASETVQRSQIRDIRASSLSLMPDGLEQGIKVGEMADLIAYLKSGNKRKVIDGNAPVTITAAPQSGTLMLAAKKAEIFGQNITYEPPFENIGMWHGTDDHIAWNLQVEQQGKYDVYLDYACAANSGGNKFALVVGDQTLKGTIAITGGDWSEYKQVRIGQVQLSKGTQRIIFRPDGPIRGALADLRTVALSPVGKKPQWPKAPVTDQDVLRDPPSVARFILDGKQSDAARQTAVNANPQFAGALITEMTRDLKPGMPEEYVRIPWIWRVAIACGKRNDAGQMLSVLEASLPKGDEPLHDWQAVVIGGGIINGISQRDVWPAERINEILNDQLDLKKRWDKAIELSSAMTDNEKVAPGTRYDALRMIAMAPFEKYGTQLVRYLSNPNGELQQGAVSGLVDVNSPQATQALIDALPKLQGGNRDFALDGLLRGKERRKALKEAVESGKVSRETVGEERLGRLNGRTTSSK